MAIHCQRMHLEPQLPSFDDRIDSRIQPPRRFIAVPVNFAMMATAERDRELIADLAAKRPALCEAQMVGVAGLPAADQAGLLGHVSDVVAVAQTAGLGKRQYAFIEAPGFTDAFGPSALGSCAGRR